MPARAKAHHPESWTPETLALAAELADGPRVIGRAEAAGVELDAFVGHASLWVRVRRPNGAAFVLRTAHLPGAPLRAEAAAGGLMSFTAAAPAARFQVTVQSAGDRLLRVVTRMTAAEPMLIAFWPRDLYPLGEGDDPTLATGEVIAAQRGFNAPVVFMRQDEPAPGALLYFQNLTSLNPWFETTGTKPDGVVGGQWPELGYQPPASPDANSPPKKPIPAGREFVLSDVFLYLPDDPPLDEVAEARMFLDGLAATYPHLDRPEARFRDWPGMAERSLRHLARSPKAGVTRYGHRFIRPYTAAEVPDSMVQLAVLLPVKDYGAWRGRPAPLQKALRAGVPRFFDRRLGTIRRFLPNIADGTEPIEKAKDKDPNEVDSWYLYHPLANLGRLALDGDKAAAELLLGSVDFAIKVARHFDYRWPVLFDVETLKVHTRSRNPGAPGQSDVGGLYAYVMIQAFELTHETRFLTEARKGILAMKGLRFDLLYQTNITAWGVMACAKLWKLTGEEAFHERMLPLVAGFFHNTIFWESELGAARRYQTFLGATCLHDGPYMAIYECFESFTAFRDYLVLAGQDCAPSVRLLLNEYCRMALSRAWGFYPSELPAEVLAPEHRNGEVDRALAFPVEDLYADGRAPGEVGQEIYGAGAAFAFASHAFHRRKGAPFTLFCDYPLRDVRMNARGLTARIDGWPDGRCRLRIPNAPKRIKARLDGEVLRGRRLKAGSWEAEAPGIGVLTLTV